MQSPFLIDDTIDSNQGVGSDIDETTLQQLDDLIEKGLNAKKEAERQKALYDSLRDQACAVLRGIGEKKITTLAGTARLKETKSGWVFSSATQELADRLRVQQDIEKRTGIATCTKTTLSADLFA